MDNHHIVNRLLVYNSDDTAVYLADLDYYVAPNSMVDLCQIFDMNVLRASISLQSAIQEKWLKVIAANNYEVLNDDAIFAASGVGRADTFRNLMFRALSGASYFIDKTYNADVYLVQDSYYNADATIQGTYNPTFSADVGLTGYLPDGITGEDYTEVITKGIDPQVVLYPKSGRYISSNGTNEFWGEGKTLSSSNEILYVNYQKTFISDNYFIIYALLKLNVVRVVGTASSITLNAYVALGDVDENTGWQAVSSSGALRGTLIGSQTIALSNDYDQVNIDVYDFAQTYVWGSGAQNGLIIEMVPTGGTANVKIVGLYSWDDDMGEMQNSIVDAYYGYTPSSYVNAIKVASITTEDTYIDSYNPYTNYGSEDLIYAEKDGLREKRALFKFDLSDIPAGSKIIKATIYIPKNVISKVEGQRDFIYRILQDWDEDSATWLKADSDTEWKSAGCHYDDSGLYDSYNLVVGEEQYQYNITKLMQAIIGSYEIDTSTSDFGFMLKGQDITFTSKDSDNLARLDVVFMAEKLNQPAEQPTLTSPSSGSTQTTQPTFIATINDDNAYGSSEGDDLNFRIEISSDASFSDDNITSFSTSTSTTGWHWSALGDWSDDSQTFPITAGSYTAGTSKVKFVMSETTSSLTAGKTWMWRLVAIDE